MAVRFETRTGARPVVDTTRRSLMTMTRIALVTALVALAPFAHAQEARTYVGVVTDTMCATNHKPMKVAPDAKCVKECVGHGGKYKYALADGKNLYTLSDQETPERF